MHRQVMASLIVLAAVAWTACAAPVVPPIETAVQDADGTPATAAVIEGREGAVTPRATAVAATHTPVPATLVISPSSTRAATAQPSRPAALPELPPPHQVEKEFTIGQYAARLWRNPDEAGPSGAGIATVSVDGTVLAMVEMARDFGELTGRDITGDGSPDLIIETYSGGAHCCFSTLVYQLGSHLTKALETPLSNCGVSFEDLDGDGVFEVITCDDSFAYTYCPYAATPAVKVILRYNPGQGYLPASPQYEAWYADDVAYHTAMAREAVPGELGEWDSSTKCAVLPLVLDFLYTGQPERAWEAMAAWYRYPDNRVFWAEILQTATDSQLFVGEVATAVAALPDHYMLQLLTSCGPDQTQVGLLQKGQSPCDLDVARRDVQWLQGQTRKIGLVSAAEHLEISPVGCTDGCRIDIIGDQDGTRVGSVRLDTTQGFPGQVYRTNGLESTYWRLRGDLTWEPVRP
jgi:hypothetical protein